MTDDEQRRASFRLSGPGGYDKDEVDAFIDLMEQELAQLADENLDLKAALKEQDLVIAQLRSELGKQGGTA
ncbi:DivIVA domain-containing protein [Nocardia arthritidis]|uniref:DivIVA domain-containing protein n=1 Tax=Nocardia arthritidis TaxID=228602 RepID=UPI0023AEEB25|nr:DivIVA domain-containing protein [Nocardia arthritidis]